MTKKTIITVATTGAWPKKENNPNIPMTPEEICEDIYDCWKAGAAIARHKMRDKYFFIIIRYYELNNSIFAFAKYLNFGGLRPTAFHLPKGGETGKGWGKLTK